VVEDTMVLAAKGKADPDLVLRRVFVWSSARAGAKTQRRSGAPTSTGSWCAGLAQDQPGQP
jgi:hypothetical protein